MQIHDLKRWQWACIGLLLGLAASVWRGWVGPDAALADHPTLEAAEFEKLLLQKSESGRPKVKDIRAYRLRDGTYWLSARQLFRRGNNPEAPEEYVPVKIPARTPYISASAAPADVDPNFTIIDYLASMKAKHPEIAFSTRWWDREPLRSSIFALGGMLLLGGICPFLSHSLNGTRAGAHPGRGKAPPEYDLSRFGRGEPEPTKPARPQPTEQDLARLRELEAELERNLASSDVSAAIGLPTTHSPAAPAHPAHPPNPEQPVRQLSAGPLELASDDDKPKTEKRYAGEFYPTETHVKRP